MNDRAANDQPAKDYIAALEQGVATIDELTAFVNSDKAKEIFGDKVGDIAGSCRRAEGLRHQVLRLRGLHAGFGDPEG